ncbi:hypothetical protein RRG08_036448 [Elysia crispata]|uniref:Uncharacterized protein n=1 Tax=Elysia crispata TaxID=231223 RepID=A0AAE1DIP2_9GAST|nr:hypothetical protein RRG08_036448 [Elysia crispata]
MKRERRHVVRPSAFKTDRHATSVTSVACNDCSRIDRRILTSSDGAVTVLHCRLPREMTISRWDGDGERLITPSKSPYRSAITGVLASVNKTVVGETLYVDRLITMPWGDYRSKDTRAPTGQTPMHAHRTNTIGSWLKQETTMTIRVYTRTLETNLFQSPMGKRRLLSSTENNKHHTQTRPVHTTLLLVLTTSRPRLWRLLDVPW